MIVVIEYGMGNVGSVLNMFKKIGVECILSSNAKSISEASKFVIPGVGSFDQGMRKLNNLKILPELTHEVLNNKKPILGICLGMQLLTQRSEEGQSVGLGWVDATTVRFKFNNHENNQLKIPHMGWNKVDVKIENSFFREFDDVPRFYFVHSYHVVCGNKENILTTANYGYEFTSSFKYENIYGVQFHPEKSHKYGMKLLENFVKYC